MFISLSNGLVGNVRRQSIKNARAKGRSIHSGQQQGHTSDQEEDQALENAQVASIQMQRCRKNNRSEPDRQRTERQAEQTAPAMGAQAFAYYLDQRTFSLFLVAILHVQ